MGGASVLVLGGGGSKKIIRLGDTPSTMPPLWETLDIRYYNNAHDTSTVFFKKLILIFVSRIFFVLNRYAE